jgi:hypothetical protein
MRSRTTPARVGSHALLVIDEELAMSYELSFWRYKIGVTLNHQAVYDSLCNGHTVDGLEELPIARMITQVSDEFSKWQRIDDVTFDSGDRGTFQIHTTPQFLRIDC